MSIKNAALFLFLSKHVWNRELSWPLAADKVTTWISHVVMESGSLRVWLGISKWTYIIILFII